MTLTFFPIPNNLKNYVPNSLTNLFNIIIKTNERELNTLKTLNKKYSITTKQLYYQNKKL